MTAKVYTFPDKKPAVELTNVKVQTCACGCQKFFLEGSGRIVCADCMHFIKNLITVVEKKEP